MEAEIKNLKYGLKCVGHTAYGENACHAANKCQRIMGFPLHRDRGTPSLRSMAYRPGNLAKTHSNLLHVPIRGNGFASRIQNRPCAIAANSTTGGRCACTGQTSRRIRAAKEPSANIAEPAVEITSYTSGGAACTKAGANRYSSNPDIENEESRSGKGILRRATGDDLTCDNNNRVAKDLSIHREGTARADKLQVCCAGFQYIAGA